MAYESTEHPVTRNTRKPQQPSRVRHRPAKKGTRALPVRSALHDDNLSMTFHLDISILSVELCWQHVDVRRFLSRHIGFGLGKVRSFLRRIHQLPQRAALGLDFVFIFQLCLCVMSIHLLQSTATDLALSLYYVALEHSLQHAMYGWSIAGIEGGFAQ